MAANWQPECEPSFSTDRAHVSYHPGLLGSTEGSGLDEREDRRWVLVEKMAADMEVIKESVRDVPEIKRIVEGHTVILNEHTATLQIHGDILREHSADIRQLKTDVKEIKQILGGVVEDVVELKIAGHSH
jgi:hypothetical protein